MVQIWKPLEEKSENDFDSGFKIPDTKALTQRLAEKAKQSLQQEHRQLEEEEEKQGKGKERKRQKQGGTICFCGSPTCSIGPFVEKQG